MHRAPSEYKKQRRRRQKAANPVVCAYLVASNDDAYGVQRALRYIKGRGHAKIIRTSYSVRSRGVRHSVAEMNAIMEEKKRLKGRYGARRGPTSGYGRAYIVLKTTYSIHQEVRAHVKRKGLHIEALATIKTRPAMAHKKGQWHQAIRCEMCGICYRLTPKGESRTEGTCGPCSRLSPLELLAMTG